MSRLRRLWNYELRLRLGPLIMIYIWIISVHHVFGAAVNAMMTNHIVEAAGWVAGVMVLLAAGIAAGTRYATGPRRSRVPTEECQS